MLALELLDRDGTHLGWLDDLKPNLGWSKTRVARTDSDGRGWFSLANDHPMWPEVTGQTGWFRLVRCYIDPPVSPTPADADFLWVIQEGPRQRLSPEGREGDVTDVDGAGGMALLGLGDYHAAVVVGSQIGQRHTGRRTFGWIARDYDSSGFDTMPTSGGQQRNPRLAARRGMPDGWVDPLAEWFWTNPSRTGSMWVLHDLSGYTGRARLHVGGRAQVWLDEDETLRSESVRDFQRVDVDLDDSWMAVKFDGEAIYTIVELDADGNLGDVLFRSTTGATFSEARNAIQEFVIDPQRAPFPWGSSYPSPGADNLQGTYRMRHRGLWTAPISYDVNSGSGSIAQVNPADVKAALEALSNIDEVTVTGHWTSASPGRVEFTGSAVSGRPQPLMDHDHTDLRHNHGTTTRRQVQSGRSLDTSTPGADAIKASATKPDGVTFGYVMSRLIALNRAEDAGAVPGVTWGFTDDLDTAGQPWEVRLDIVSYRDGEQVGQIAVQGCQRFAVDCLMLPTLELAAYNTSQFGVDRSGTVELTDGQVIAAANLQEKAPRATVVRIGTSGGYGWAVDTAEVAKYGWRATSAMYGMAETVEEVQVAAGQLLDRNRGGVVQTVVVDDVSSFDVGDWVAVRTVDGGPYLPYRVEAIAPTQVDAAGNREFDVDLELKL